MRNLLPVLLVFLQHSLIAQTPSELKAALSIRDKAVQAIHNYPKNIQDGECHHVNVTAISINGDEIVITETWKNLRGGLSNTVLKGKLVNQQAEGTWSSSFSSGKWSYNFQSNQGKWNKTGSIFDRFSTFQILTFKIIEKDKLKDGFFACP
jgi:hypothetical protein